MDLEEIKAAIRGFTPEERSEFTTFLNRLIEADARMRSEKTDTQDKTPEK